MKNKVFKLWLNALICIVLAMPMAVNAEQVPDLGNARIIVLANNLQNYYYNYAESSRPSYNTDEGRAAKTRKIVNMMLASGADIFAFCEVEAKPIVLQQLADSLNARVGGDDFAAVSDGIYIETDEYDNAIKSGFIYRKATVEPYGSNYAAATASYYKNTMRIQAWTELATGEQFTISMNHFKAMSDDAAKAQRIKNANWLLAGLNNSSKVKDPDILILGDLNCEVSEQALQNIINAGYEEQLLRFDDDSYSYIYKGNHELIDHALANSSMADQITGAAVWHTNTSVAYNSRYSDHDAVMVGIFEESSDDIETITITLPTKKILHNGQLIIERGGVQYSITGQRL